MPLPQKSHGAISKFRYRRVLIRFNGFRAKYTVPLVGVSSAASKCSKVLLPAPDGATIATISPRRKLRFASTKIGRVCAPDP